MAAVALLSGDVHSGKTTQVRQWLERLRAAGKSAAGILAGPDIDGLRHLTSIATGEVKKLQIRDMEEAKRDGLSVCSICNYVFDNAVFEWARGEIERAAFPVASSGAVPPLDYLILDEVGPLELREGIGLEPMVTRIFTSLAQLALRGTTVVVVVRATSAPRFREKYNLSNVLTFADISM
ncbi:hypothetical protein Pelo_13661 [Pelomyxa schiedti]|nr:hypothetical protein Pelo_13661 [Pelomyxa schiedti]